MPLRSEKLTFENRAGHLLDARLELPEDEPAAYAIFAHCFTCSKDIAAASRISRALGRRGFAVLRFDFTGLGNSEGDFGNTNFSSNVDDLRCAAEHLRAHYQAPALLIGHSLGGAAVLSAAPDLPEVNAVATIAAPAEPDHLRKLLIDSAEDAERTGSATIRLGSGEFRVSRQFFDDMQQHRLADRIHRLGSALLVMHSPRDRIVPIGHAREIFEAARHPKSFVSLDDADHLISRPEDADYAAGIIAAWSTRHVAGAGLGAARQAPDAGGEWPEAAEGGVIVQEHENLTQRVRAGHHQLIADEPADVGGDDRGPSPYDLLLAALGACTSMTLRMYARHKQWPVDGIRVNLQHRRIHAHDCDSCETKDGRLSEIERLITVDGDLDDEQRQRLLEIANKCPVHRTLKGEISIPTDFA